MASIDEISKKYARRLFLASNPYSVADEIVKEIENLSYESSGEKISIDDKKILTDLIGKEYNKLDNEKYKHPQYIIEKSDNKNFLDLVSYINVQLSGGKK